MKSPFSAKTVQPDISLSVCGYRKVLDIISSKWTALVIYAMEDGIIRYGEIRRRIEGISKKMLTQTLRQLERDGLVKRVITPSVPPIVEYSLTRLGESLLEPMRALNKWTKEHYSLVEQARAAYDQGNNEE
ncbi:DNA-binding HxlR family transcriptional regulator [Paenibacillus forsythiae]|uniref:DNA-binding HxlR family transcriptional regulator n=1 Tax=Paenibacillus forsythiae TaxID=365616 RepID=A0ABU3HHK0_9BACL|nr:helix-turn-helix domain-containing protein [Paenibacillus forsythiae]MDT3429150.1 DNA-binding HxlR family transcriptional regulator [Paenibacillus forsythiae]